MDLDFNKSLEQLESKKKALNEQSDLTNECNSIIELDHRIGLLLREIRNLKQDIEEQSNLICTTSDKLAPSDKILQKTSDLFDLTQNLTKLNRLCRLIDKIQVQKQLCPDRKPSPKSDSEIQLSNEEDDIPLSFKKTLKIVDKFDDVYLPLEGVLSLRKDLPYVHYAEKARVLRDCVNSQCSQSFRHSNLLSANDKSLKCITVKFTV